MKNLDMIVTILGIAYGFWLVFVFLVKSNITEPFRLDIMFLPNSSESTRLLNLLVGMLVAGYCIYSLLRG